MRGLSPEGLKNALNVAIQIRQFKTQELVRQQTERAAQEKATTLWKKQQVESDLKAEKLAYDRGKVSYSPIRKVGGRQIRDMRDDRGIILESVDLGPIEEAPEKVETLAQKRKLELQLAEIDFRMADPDADPEALKGYRDFFNTNTKGDYKWVMQPGESPKKVPSWVPFLGGADVPGTGGESILKRISDGDTPQKTITRTGTDAAGRKVIQYSDGSLEYAD